MWSFTISSKVGLIASIFSKVCSILWAQFSMYVFHKITNTEAHLVTDRIVSISLVWCTNGNWSHLNSCKPKDKTKRKFSLSHRLHEIQCLKQEDILIAEGFYLLNKNHPWLCTSNTHNPSLSTLIKVGGKSHFSCSSFTSVKNLASHLSNFGITISFINRLYSKYTRFSARCLYFRTDMWPVFLSSKLLWQTLAVTLTVLR